MEKIKNVSLYNDDLEIIDILSKIPPLPEHGNIPILRYLDENSNGKNVGGVIISKKKVYTFYKFDKKFFKEGEAGLILAISSEKYAMEQLEIFRAFKTNGMDISDKILNQIEAGLVGIQMAYLFHNEPK